jgi:hypothetical protein
MAKEKLTLNDIKVASTVTSLNADEMSQLKGGAMSIRGRRYNYRTRWTMVDIRADVADAIVINNGGGHGG